MRAVLVLVILGGCLRTPPFAGIDSGAGSGVDARPVDAPAATNIAFVSSMTTSVDSLAMGPNGALAAADSFCTTQANNNGHMGTFHAWLSSGSEAAISRLPAGTRGWSRTDGKPFADTVTDIAAGKIFYPLRLDENGNDIGSAEVMTGTKADGTASPSNCNGLAGGNGYILIGNADATTQSWTDVNAGRTCSTAEHVYCFQVELATPVVVPPSPLKRAFLSAPWAPAGGVTGANTQCQSEATAAGLVGTYVAFISTSNATAAERFAGQGPWARIDRVEVASSSSNMLGGKIDAPLNVDAAGGYHGFEQVWTGAGSPSTPTTTSLTCTDWNPVSGSDTGATGLANHSDNTWFGYATTGSVCGGFQRLYCVEI